MKIVSNLTQLIITNDAEVKEISHYTSIETFEKMSKDENNSFIRLVSLAAANDKIEGNVLPLLFLIIFPRLFLILKMKTAILLCKHLILETKTH